MKKYFCVMASACLIFMTGCGQSDHIENISSDIQEEISEPEQHNVDIEYMGEDNVDSVKMTTISFVNGMGCSDPNCTDASHHHDCPSDCDDYEHHHNCGLDCTEESHHHANTGHEEEHHADSVTVTNVTFVNGMGCSDPDCTDASHHHDCPADCDDYEHHHNCGLDCTEESHHHAYTEHEEEHYADSVQVTNVSFVNGMGCSDPNCTDATHHHDCPADCEDYEHHHNCDLDCTEESHHHGGTNTGSGTTQHHTEQRHGSSHH